MHKTTTAAIVLFALMLLSHADAWAIPHSVRVFDTQKQFVNVTKAVNVLIPSSQTAFPGTTCGLPDSGPVTGWGSSITMFFDANSVTVTHPQGGAVSLCIFDKGFTDPVPNETVPSTMIANTILGNGLDQYLLTFARPVEAVGLDLLTSHGTKASVTLRDETGAIISTEDILGLTQPNSHGQFVGFQSKKADIKFFLEESNGSQNQGIEGLWVASDSELEPVPEPTTILLVGTTAAGLGLARWRQRRRKRGATLGE